MKLLQINCGKCKRPLSLPLPEASVHSPCPECGADIEVAAFPALIRKFADSASGESLVVDDDSSCFYHPTKKAAIACEACGRFLCSLCDIDFNERHLCPACFESGASKGKVEALEKGRLRYDEIALFLSIVPIIFYCVTILTAPATLFVTIRYWKAPLSVVRYSKWRFVVASLLAGAQLLLWGLFGFNFLGAYFGAGLD
jgi:hypothetical protein